MSKVSKSIKGKHVIVAGASGTIGRAVVRHLISDGHDVTALVRLHTEQACDLEATTICGADLDDERMLIQTFQERQADTLISCIASRSGERRDAERVDFLGNLNLLKAAQASGVEHFILLSAICVQRPKLAFQHAKIAFERALKASGLAYTIVHPTAFFKSLSGQVDRVLAGKPFLLFGNGELTRCKPISDDDLARFIVGCVTDPACRGKTLPIGGPGPAITLKQQGELLFEAAKQEPRFRSVPVGLFDAAITVLSIPEKASDWFADKAEYARIGKYYATESMLHFDPIAGRYSAQATPEFGSDTLLDHYKTLVAKRAA